MARTPRVKHDWSAVHRLALQGLTFDQLSIRFGIKSGTIRSRAHREKWNISKIFPDRAGRPPASPKREARNKPKGQELTDLLARQDASKFLASIQTDLPTFIAQNSSAVRIDLVTTLRRIASYFASLSPSDAAKKLPDFANLIKGASILLDWNPPKTEAHLHLRGAAYRRSRTLDALWAADPEELAALSQSSAAQKQVPGRSIDSQNSLPLPNGDSSSADPPPILEENSSY